MSQEPTGLLLSSRLRNRGDDEGGLCQHRGMTGVEIKQRPALPGDVRRLLDALPEWFGIESSNDAYVQDSQTHQSYVALRGSDVVGVLMLKHHNPNSAEVHLLAVMPGEHHHGIGSALLGMAELGLVRDGCALLHVKTLGPSDPDEFYARTRQFYARRGFTALEERHDIWPDDACLIMVKPLLHQRESTR